MYACTPTLSPSALRTARRGHPTPGHPEYTFLGFSVLKSFFAFAWRGPDIPGGGHSVHQMLVVTDAVVKAPCPSLCARSVGPEVWAKRLGYRMEMTLPLARVSYPARY